MKTLLIFLIISVVSSPVLSEHQELKEWFKLISNPAENCHGKLSDVDLESATPILEIANDCNEENARWDYNYHSKKKTKRGVFEGQSKLSFPQWREHNDFKVSSIKDDGAIFK